MYQNECRALGHARIKIFLFLVDEWREDPNITINGPSSARQRNAI